MKKKFEEEAACRKDKENEKFTEELVEFVKSEFLRRRSERYLFERQWELNLNYLSGSQYGFIDGRGEISVDNKAFCWQNREVYNHIAPIIESRLAKFSRVEPVLGVRPLSGDEDDVRNSVLAERLVKEAMNRSDMYDVVKQVTAWSETCGTAFYKVVWQNDGGKVVGELKGVPVYEGDIKIVPVSPFEIFPDSVYTEKLADCKSVIHARAMTVKDIWEKYKISVQGEDVGVYDLNEKSTLKIGKTSAKSCINGANVVIEYYEKPTDDYPQGRLITVCDDKLLYYGELPYENGKNGTRDFPFVKQESIFRSGSFFGVSVIERLIPVQRAYNAVKNRKHEFLNRLSMGVMMVEDGSLDVDDLATDGLSPGKILVYRQGSNPPSVLLESSIPDDFRDEEEKLMNEFVAISGLSDVSSSKQNSKLSSGSALELLVSQDNERMTVNAETIRRCYVEVARQILKLYAQFISGVRTVNYQDSFNKTRICYADNNAAKSDDVYLESENELLYTPKQKKEMILKLYESGLLLDDDGKTSGKTKEKVLSLLGYGELYAGRGIYSLHEEKARAENEKMLMHDVETDGYDDHALHVSEHVRYALSEREDLTEAQKERIVAHIAVHESKLAEKNELNFKQ